MDPQLMTLVSTTWGILGVAAGLGIAVLAVQQMLQHFLGLRQQFQRKEIHALVHSLADAINRRLRILDRGGGDNYSFERAEKVDSEAARSPQARPVDPDRAVTNMVQLATAGREDALYRLPIDQLAGQLSVAAQSVLDFPRHYPDLLLILSSGAEAEDLITVLQEPPRDAVTPSATEPPSSPAIAYIDARNRVAHQVQRNLDALQIHMRYWLQLYLQLWAIVFGLVFAFLLVWLGVGNPFESWPLLREWIACGILAGFFSTLFTNILDALLARKGGS